MSSKKEAVYYSSAPVFTPVKSALMTMAFEKWMTQVKSYYSCAREIYDQASGQE